MLIKLKTTSGIKIAINPMHIIDVIEGREGKEGSVITTTLADNTITVTESYDSLVKKINECFK